MLTNLLFPSKLLPWTAGWLCSLTTAKTCTALMTVQSNQKYMHQETYDRFVAQSKQQQLFHQFTIITWKCIFFFEALTLSTFIKFFSVKYLKSRIYFFSNAPLIFMLNFKTEPHVLTASGTGVDIQKRLKSMACLSHCGLILLSPEVVVSKWLLMSCQLHRVISIWLNSIISK